MAAMGWVGAWVGGYGGGGWGVRGWVGVCGGGSQSVFKRIPLAGVPNGTIQRAGYGQYFNHYFQAEPYFRAQGKRGRKAVRLFMFPKWQTRDDKY